MEKQKHHLDASQIKELKRDLETKKSELVREFAQSREAVTAPDEEKEAYGLHSADGGSQEVDRYIQIGLSQVEQDLLTDIEAALKRIVDGTYGYSIRAPDHKPIPYKRLKIVPWAKLTVQEQEEEEQTKRRTSVL
jgi:DnaK suppressor protein